MKVPCRELMPLIATEVLERGARARLTVEGNSMTPLLRSGDTVEVEALGDHPLRVGDVVLARDATDTFLLHRVARVDGERCYLLGDAQRTVAGPFARAQVLGRVTGVWRGGRRLHAVLGPAGRLWGALPGWRVNLLCFLRRCRQTLRRLRGDAASQPPPSAPA